MPNAARCVIRNLLDRLLQRHGSQGQEIRGHDGIVENRRRTLGQTLAHDGPELRFPIVGIVPQDAECFGV